MNVWLDDERPMPPQNLVARDEMKAAIRNARRYWNPALGEPE